MFFKRCVPVRRFAGEIALLPDSARRMYGGGIFGFYVTSPNGGLAVKCGDSANI